MEISARIVGDLRQQTGAGMMECKKALIEAEGDFEKARDILRAKGKAGAEKRAGRAAADGVVAAVQTSAASALVELNSETDFVARNEEFRALAGLLAQSVADNAVQTVEEVLNLTVDGTSVKQKLEDVLARLRENIVFKRFVRYETTPESVMASYIHAVNHKIGVLVELKGDPNNADQLLLARGIAMHVAASKPDYLRREEVPADVVEREKAVLAEKTRNEGKPEAAIPKIVEGRIGKFYEQFCLVEQPYVKDPSKKIGVLLKEAGAEIVRFALFTVGQA